MNQPLPAPTGADIAGRAAHVMTLPGHSSRRYRVMLVLALLFCFVAIVMLWDLYRRESAAVAMTLVHSASQKVRALRTFRELYTTEVVERAMTQGIQVTHDYDDHDGAIPLPATLTIMMGDRLGQNGSDLETHLFSDYPFPWRRDGGPRDLFQQDALRYLGQHPEEPFTRIEERHSRRVLRYAVADRMIASCVACHNNHPDSPKRDWQVGDVRGVLEVDEPAESVASLANLKPGHTVILVGALALAGIVLVGFATRSAGRSEALLQTRARQLEQEVSQRACAEQELQNLNQTLERRVASRTQELEASRGVALAKMADAQKARGLAEQTNVQLTKAHERFRQLLESAPDAMVIADDKGTIVLVNAQTERVFGYDRTELLNQPIEILLPARFRAEHVQKRSGYCDNPEPRPMGGHRELLGLRKDGTEFPAEISLSPLHTDDGMLVCSAIRDITARKQAEEIDRHRRSLQDTVNAMQKVLGVVGHELRTPLAALRATSEFLLADEAKEADEWDVFLKIIHDETIRMGDLVNNLLEAACLDSGRTRWNWDRVSVSAACQRAMDVVRPLVDQSKVQLTVEVSPDDLMMNGDSDAIQRLMINLLTNAVKHVTRGTIAVSAQKVIDSVGPWVEIRVHDTGSGIPPHVMAQLGQAFALNHGCLGADFIKGSGLGLAICKGIASAHAGAISVTSSVDQGSIFIARLRADLTGPAAPPIDARITYQSAA